MLEAWPGRVKPDGSPTRRSPRHPVAKKGTTYQLEAKVVDNTLLPEAKITGDLLPTFK